MILWTPQLTVFNNELYFSAVDANGCTLWESDGTPSKYCNGKRYQISSTSSSNCPLVNSSWKYMTGYDSTNGEALWKYDGTTAGTVMVKDTYTGGMTNGPARLTVLGMNYSSMVTTTLQGNLCGNSDGTNAPVMVKDTHTSSTGWDQDAEVGSALYFVGFDTSSGYALWRSDGTTGGTYKVRILIHHLSYNAPQDLVAFGNMVFFIIMTQIMDGHCGKVMELILVL